MQRNRVWLVLALLVILAAALVFWLMPREGSSPNVAFESQDTPSNKPTPAATPAEPETPSPPMISDAAPKTPPNPATPETLAVPKWEPLPPVPAPRFRKLTMADIGQPSEAEVARIRANVASQRYHVTIRGKVRDQSGNGVGGAKVRAHSAGVCGPLVSYEEFEFSVFRIRHPSDPSGQTVTDESGNYSLELQVTCSSVSDLLRSVNAEEHEQRGAFQGDIIVRAETQNMRGNGRLVIVKDPDAVIDNIDLAVYAGPLVTFAVRDSGGQAVPCAYLDCHLTKPMDPAAGRGSNWQVYADEEGLIHLPREDGWQYTMLANNGFGTSRRVFAPITEERARSPIPIEVGGPLDIGAVMFRALKEGSTQSPHSVAVMRVDKAELLDPTADGWRRVSPLHRIGRQLVVLARGCGTVQIPMPEIPAGYCAEYDPVAFPGEREVQVRVIDEQGRPLAHAYIDGRLAPALWPPEGIAANEPTPHPATTDADGRANLRVMPGRSYRMTATLKSGQITIRRDWIFTGPGPHEWRWQSESGK